MTEFGVGTYTRNVVRALGRLDRHNQYFLMGPPQKMTEIGPLPANFQSVPLLDGDTTVKGSLAFRSILRHLNCNLVHIPHLFWLPRALPCPYVMTVHDVLEHMWRTREHSGARRLLHFQLTRRVLLSASRVFAVSKFTKSELEKLFSIPPRKVEVVYNAVDERFMHGHASEADREL